MSYESITSKFDQERLSIYTSGLANLNTDAVQDQNYSNLFICGASESKSHFLRRHANQSADTRISDSQYRSYIREAQRLVRLVDRHAAFAIYADDCRDRFDTPVLVKSRLLRDRDAPCILLPLDWKRHWRDVFRVSRHDIHFRNKVDRLVWRGATTGAFQSTSDVRPYSSRFHLARLNIRRRDIDIGYSHIVQIAELSCDIPIKEISAKLRPPLTMAEQLQSKLLLSLEGNDVASGLKWMLYSNSVVVMPQPTCESWACEGELVPFVHYVPIKSDLTDIEEVVDWCCTHTAECENIVLNAKKFVAPFLDRKNELRIAREVIRAYLAKSAFALNYDMKERLAQFVKSPLLNLNHPSIMRRWADP